MTLRSRAVKALVQGAYSLTPPGRHVCICTFPDFDDQGLAVVEELLERGHSIVWLTSADGAEHPQAARLSALGVRMLRRLSWRGFWAYLRARVVFHTHGLFGNPNPCLGKSVVNLWHGMPIKKIGLDLTGAGRIAATATIATGPKFQMRLARAFGEPLSRVWVTGLPRNDRMLRASTEETRVSTDLIPSKGKTLLWLPTFRDWITPKPSDTADAVTQVLGIAPDELKSVVRSLEDANVTCLVKPHPLAPQPGPLSLGSLRLVTDAEMESSGSSLYQLLGMVDGLVTDYSSVWIDFLLLDRPIIFFIPDEARYLSTRGIQVERSGRFFPGPIARTPAELTAALTDFAEDSDGFAEARYAAKRELHSYDDAASTVRLMDRLGL